MCTEEFFCNYLFTAETYLVLLSNCALTSTPIAASVPKNIKNIFKKAAVENHFWVLCKGSKM